MGAALERSFKRLETLGGAVWKNLGAAIAPAVLKATNSIQGILVKTNRWIKDNQALVATVYTVGTALVVAGGIITGVGLSFVVLGDGRVWPGKRLGFLGLVTRAASVRSALFPVCSWASSHSQAGRRVHFWGPGLR